MHPCDRETDRETKVRWLRRTTVVAAVARKKVKGEKLKFLQQCTFSTAKLIVLKILILSLNLFFSKNVAFSDDSPKFKRGIASLLLSPSTTSSCPPTDFSLKIALPTCNYFHAKLADSGRVFNEFLPQIRRVRPTRRHCALSKRIYLLSNDFLEVPLFGAFVRRFP